MNKKLILLAIGVLMVIVTIVVLFKRTTPDYTVTTRLLEISEKEYLTADTTRGAITIGINIEIPEKANNQEVLEKIRKQVLFRLFGKLTHNISPDSLLRQFVDELKQDYLKNNQEFATKLQPWNKLVFNHSLFLEGFSLLNDGKIYSYGISREVDLGGTFPAQTRFYYNFDMQSGEILTEKDIFIEGFENELTEIIKEQIMAESQTNEDFPVISSFKQSPFIIEAIQPNGNFYLNDEAICFVFNPYEIAPINFIRGAEVSLKYPTIKHLMKLDSPVYYLVELSEKNQP